MPFIPTRIFSSTSILAKLVQSRPLPKPLHSVSFLKFTRKQSLTIEFLFRCEKVTKLRICLFQLLPRIE